MSLREINIEELSFNPFTKVGKDWILIAAGDEAKHNMMTASFGGFGILWMQNVSFIFVREQRYTYEFIENNDHYCLCFFDEDYREALRFCGVNSGRDFDKVKETGLTPNYNGKAPYFEEASLVLVCRKLYRQDMTEDSFVDKQSLERVYPARDFHRTYVGAIEKVLVK